MQEVAISKLLFVSLCVVLKPRGGAGGGQRSVDTWGRVTLGQTLSPVSLGW